MSTVETPEIANALDRAFEEDDRVVVAPPEAASIAALNKSEVEAQLDAAHKYKRNVTTFLREAASLATVSEEVARSCMYSVPRDGKHITGPSVRLAEICMSAYQNLHAAARVVDITDREIVAQGGAWDLERNLRVTVEVRRKITGKGGRRFSEDMINMTGNAACSIALRNAIFRVVPRAYVDTLYQRIKLVAIGKAETLAAKRTAALDRLGKMGADKARVLNALGLKGEADITLEHLETLIGFETALKAGDKQVDELFPAVMAEMPGAAAAPEGKRMSLNKGKGNGGTVPHDPVTGEVKEPGSDG